jgi:ATP-binding cassette subfamily B protein
MRFYDVDSGCISIDGTDIRNITREKLRSVFGMVLQDTWLFEGTIRDNIAYGRAGATEEEIVKAAKAAKVHRFIKTLADGYDTVLEENGTNISQGQRQLITIARAMLSRTPMLIFDEATSNVDSRTEIKIQQAMNALMEGRTSFVIAHRLSTIRNADRILVLQNGVVTEQGSHEELLALGGFYSTLYNSQFQ